MGDHIYVVADPGDERARLQELAASYPGTRFIGLAEHLLPALTAGNNRAVFQPMNALTMPKSIVLVFAAPRTGSSLLSDLLTDLGQGDVREHLRPPIIAALESDYAFDRQAAFRNFLCLAQRGGVFGSKLITHFFEDCLHGSGNLGLVHTVCAGVPLKVITLDRADTVAQMISGELAAQRGVWHITDATSEKAVLRSAAPSYNFSSLLKRYFRYRKESAIIEIARKAFPDNLALEYGRDIECSDLAALATKICDFLELPPPVLERFARAEKRKRIADERNVEMIEHFVVDWKRYFSGGP
jgi:LPS sulfotransferase NodH